MQIAEFGHRHVAPLQAIRDDQSLRVLAADGLDRFTDYRRIDLRRDVARLVHEIEAQPRAGNAAIVAGKHGPMFCADPLRLGVHPKIGFFRRDATV